MDKVLICIAFKYKHYNFIFVPLLLDDETLSGMAVIVVTLGATAGASVSISVQLTALDAAVSSANTGNTEI